MGSLESGEDRYSDETPHLVRISRGFWMLETPVTQEMYESLMGTNPSYFSSAGQGRDVISGSTAKYPVEMVSWDEANNFCEKLSELSGFHCQLPTVVQWEYACRAGTMDKYGGNGILDEIGWYRYNG